MKKKKEMKQKKLSIEICFVGLCIGKGILLTDRSSCRLQQYIHIVLHEIYLEKKITSNIKHNDV